MIGGSIPALFDIEGNYKHWHKVNNVETKHPDHSNGKVPSDLIINSGEQKPSKKNIQSEGYTTDDHIYVPKYLFHQHKYNALAIIPSPVLVFESCSTLGSTPPPGNNLATIDQNTSVVAYIHTNGHLSVTKEPTYISHVPNFSLQSADESTRMFKAIT